MMTKKADLSDIQRVLASLDSKVDSVNFNQIALALENKADKFELAMGGGSDPDVSGKVNKLFNDFEEMDRKFGEVERNMQRLMKDQDGELETLRQ